MTLRLRWVNGLVFGLSHTELYDISDAEGDTVDEKMENARAVPIITLHLGPFQFLLTW